METTSLSSTSTAAFNSNDVDNVADYRSLSAMAIIGMLFGLASPLCLLSPVFMLIPICGVAISLVALRNIHLSDGMLAGRWAAVIGLTLSIICGIAVLSRSTVTRYLRTAEAEKFATEWLGMLAANKTAEAFRLSLEGARPPSPPEPGMPPATTTPYGEFSKDPLVQKMVAVGEDPEISLVATLEYKATSNREFQVLQRYQISAHSEKTANAAGDIEAELLLQRSHFPGQKKIRWLITQSELVPPNKESQP